MSVAELKARSKASIQISRIMVNLTHKIPFSGNREVGAVKNRLAWFKTSNFFDKIELWLLRCHESFPRMSVAEHQVVFAAVKKMSASFRVAEVVAWRVCFKFHKREI